MKIAPPPGAEKFVSIEAFEPGPPKLVWHKPVITDVSDDPYYRQKYLEAQETVDGNYVPPGKTVNKLPAPRIVAKPYVYRDPKTIPPRQWLHAGHYVRGFLSATIATGGLGKTNLQLIEAVGMPIGRDILRRHNCEATQGLVLEPRRPDGRDRTPDRSNPSSLQD